MQIRALFSTWLVLVVSCGGNAFTPAVDDSTLTDAHQEPSEIDAPPFPREASADVQGKGEASVSVEASTDGGAVSLDAADENAREAGVDAGRDPSADAWPSDVVVDPVCPENELWPIYSLTCDTWGQTHGWTLPGCCLPDHTCGTVRDFPTRGCYR
jgi:hypothetical protein